MIQFFKTQSNSIIAVYSAKSLCQENIEKLIWLFSGATYLKEQTLVGWFVGPRKEMLTPWSTNAVEITQNMGVEGIRRMEEFFEVDNPKAKYDPMLQTIYEGLTQQVFAIDKEPDPILNIEDIAAYNEQEGLALSDDEIQYLNNVSKEMGRPLTDGEVYGFAQVNSEHCRHKIFNGTFIIDGKEM
jgi:phosphoribosylformylglycinamidine synthase